jgi:hypothetical protein
VPHWIQGERVEVFAMNRRIATLFLTALAFSVLWNPGTNQTNAEPQGENCLRMSAACNSLSQGAALAYLPLTVLLAHRPSRTALRRLRLLRD